jgi:hypothetical protein
MRIFGAMINRFTLFFEGDMFTDYSGKEDGAGTLNGFGLF